MNTSCIAFANGELGQRVVRAMAGAGGLKAVFVHPAAKASKRDIIEELARDAGASVVEVAPTSEARVAQLRDIGQIDVGVSAGYGYIMRSDEYTYPRFGTVNLHTSLLPLNRGAHPNAWAIAEGTAAGVTLHFVDSGVDTGDILVQVATPYTFADTAQSLYARLVDDAEMLFREFWPKPASFWRDPPRVPQRGAATEHRVSDLETLRLPSDERQMSVGEMLRILRARTFPPHPGALVEVEGRRYRLRLEIDDVT